MSDLAHPAPLGSSPALPLPGRPPRQEGWLLHPDRARAWALAALALFAAYAILGYMSGFPAPDFTALWSYGRMVQEHPAAALYDDARLHAYQVALGMDAAGRNPFPYPPVFVLLVWPLGLLPVWLAFHAWIAVTLAAFVWAAAGGRLRLLPMAALLLSPVTTTGVIAGQSGFLSGALLIGGLRLAPSRPWLGGLLIALLTYKPQLGLLVPVALAAAGAWRAIAATCVWTAALAALTGALFGLHIWTDWLGTLPDYATRFATRDALLHLQPTPLANLELAGLTSGAAHAAQAVLACAMAAAVWRTWRGGVSAAAIGVLAAATFVATPHAFFYDMPMLTAALLYLGGARLRDGGLGPGEAAFLFLAMWVPAAMLCSEWPVSLPVLLPFAIWAAWRAAPAQAAANCSSASRAYSPP